MTLNHATCFSSHAFILSIRTSALVLKARIFEGSTFPVSLSIGILSTASVIFWTSPPTSGVVVCASARTRIMIERKMIVKRVLFFIDLFF